MAKRNEQTQKDIERVRVMADGGTRKRNSSLWPEKRIKGMSWASGGISF